MQLPGWTKNFIYEEFYPNHDLDMRNRVNEFMDSWFEKSFNEYSWELDKTFITTKRNIISKEELIQKFNLVFLSFNRFLNSSFEISEISFNGMKKKKELVMPKVKVSYDAELENGELIKYEGSFKLYMANEFGMWKIYYFVFPGFNWDSVKVRFRNCRDRKYNSFLFCSHNSVIWQTFINDLCHPKY